MSTSSSLAEALLKAPLKQACTSVTAFALKHVKLARAAARPGAAGADSVFEVKRLSFGLFFKVKAN